MTPGLLTVTTETAGVKVVRREADYILIPDIHKDMRRFANFRNLVTQAVVTASCRDQEAFDFIVIVEYKETTFEELAYCPPELRSIDQKLLLALQGKASDGKHSTMMLELKQYYENAKRERRLNGDAAMLRGRQALWLIYEHFRTSTHDGTLYGFRHLQLVEWKGDTIAQLEFFDAEITRVLAGMEEQPREVDIQDHYIRQFRKTKELQLCSDLAYFDRLEDGHTHKKWT